MACNQYLIPLEGNIFVYIWIGSWLMRHFESYGIEEDFNQAQSNLFYEPVTI